MGNELELDVVAAMAFLVASTPSTWPCRDGVVPTQDWKSRPIPALQGTGILTEELEESIMQMQTFLTMRHVAPFREEATELLANLNDAADTLEQWVKVQLMWCSLESVFTGGDIAKQLPMEAKKFSKVDKDWTKIMRVSPRFEV